MPRTHAPAEFVNDENSKGAFSFCKSAKEFAAKEKLKIVIDAALFESEPEGSSLRVEDSASFSFFSDEV